MAAAHRKSLNFRSSPTVQIFREKEREVRYGTHESSSTPLELGERFTYPNPALAGGANDIQPLPGLVLKISITGINNA